MTDPAATLQRRCSIPIYRHTELPKGNSWILRINVGKFGVSEFHLRFAATKLTKSYPTISVRLSKVHRRHTRLALDRHLTYPIRTQPGERIFLIVSCFSPVFSDSCHRPEFTRADKRVFAISYAHTRTQSVRYIK